MTTNVRDSHQGLVATDSRWTWDLRPMGHPIQLLVDDSGYEKLLTCQGRSFMFAGSSDVIDMWKTAIRQAAQNPASVDWGRIPVNGMAISAIDLGTGNIRFESGHEIQLDVEGFVCCEGRHRAISFAGSGSYPAAGCWTVNKNARRAVESAKSSDPHTGGTVRYQDVMNGEHNLVEDQPLQSLVDLFREPTRRIVMQANVPTKVPFEDVASNDDSLQEILKKAQLQGVMPAAPCDAVYNTWTDLERQKLVRAMNEIFPS